jgi:iron only hydrogenase large subunit-like protein
MPCYDKKLEAVRPTVMIPSQAEIQSLMEVDTVIATHELLELFDKTQTQFPQVQVNTPDQKLNQFKNSMNTILEYS